MESAQRLGFGLGLSGALDVGPVWVDEANHAACLGGVLPEDTQLASWPEVIAVVEKRVKVLRELDALRWWLEAAKEGRRGGTR